VLFGGHDHVLETAGLTYSEYAHQGFWQMLAAAVLTLGVVAGAALYARPESRSERLLLRILLGSLCGMTIVVLVSVLHRMRLYEEAYGLTRLRLLVEAFAAWLGVVFALVLTGGAWQRVRAQLLRIGVAVTAAGLIAFSVAGPDRLIAERNVDRWRATGEIDRYYLATLSSDAVPVLLQLPHRERAIALADHRRELERDQPWHSANLSRRRARDLLGL
jgi:hypothetical protein